MMTSKMQQALCRMPDGDYAVFIQIARQASQRDWEQAVHALWNIDRGVYATANLSRTACLKKCAKCDLIAALPNIKGVWRVLPVPVKDVEAYETAFRRYCVRQADLPDSFTIA